MRTSTQAALMTILPGVGIVATLIDGVSDGFSAWNAVAILAFAAVVGAGLSLARRVR
jgi:hypothetical protein